jgi:outer membrane protein assembly factor BamE (lipoprotein component of BamABCDE complex)
MASSRLNLLISLALVASVGLGCMGMRKPWRDYSEKPFNSKEWLAGDRIERGRMKFDIFKKRIPNGKTREQVREIFGDPDIKKTVEGKEVWFYRIDIGIQDGLDLFPISFDNKGEGYVGVVTGSTISIGAKENEL